METPETLLRLSVVEEFHDHAVELTLKDLSDHLDQFPGVWWNAYSQKYGVKIKDFPYEARNGFFFDISSRLATHRFISKGIGRRDRFIEDKDLAILVPQKYRNSWFDINDAVRCYSVLITEIVELTNPISVENFGLFNSWGKVSSKDQFHRPRLIKPVRKN